jgi:hypothetical protein
MDRKLMLFSLSDLEQGRIQEPKSDLKDLSGSPLREPKSMDRPFEDENLLKKLIQYKNQIPLSPRIIRARDT